MTMNLNTLYSELIFEHDKHPKHTGLREPFDADVHHVNPVCGDEIQLRLKLSEDGATVEDISYEAAGCAMSRASASMMADLFIGEPVSDIEEMTAHFDEVLHSRGKVEAEEEIIGDAVALAGAAKFPNRVKCVLMSWKAFQAAYAEALLFRQQ